MKPTTRKHNPSRQHEHAGGEWMQRLFAGLALGMVVLSAQCVWAQPLDKAKEAVFKKQFDAQTIGIELKLQGEYVGKNSEKQVGVQVAGRGNKSFHALVLEGGLPEDGWDGGRYGLLESGPMADGRVEFSSPSDEGLSAVLDENGLMLKRGGQQTLLKRVERKSTTLGMPPPKGAIVLFGGAQPNVDPFEQRKDIEGETSPLMYENNLMAGAVTKRKFRDFTLHAEFMTGWEPLAIPWRRADSGIYMLSRYEVAIGDNFGFDFDVSNSVAPNRPKLLDNIKSPKFSLTQEHKRTPRVCGSVFGMDYPGKVPNPCLPPVVWQTVDVEFQAPRFDTAGKKTSNAVMSVKLNGHQTVEKLQVKGPTPHGFRGPEAPDGPIWFESFGANGFSRRVLYRNIWVVEREASQSKHKE
ncbi:MAG: DUF1080 domain-containing protein [Planctomycetota bacterium]